MRHLIPIALGVLAAHGCASQAVPTHVLPTDAATLANFVELPVSHVVVTDGIDRIEAERLAGDYFFGLFGVGCGSLSYRTERKDAWVFSTRLGYASTPGSDIIVRKDGSVVYQRGGPDLFSRDGAWFYDRRQNPTADLDKAISEALEKRANQSLQPTAPSGRG